MTWLAWRVQRLPLLASGAAVAALAVWLVVQGHHEQTLWSCLTQHIHPIGSYLYCPSAWSAWNITHWNIYFLGILLFTPGLVGLILGVPVVAQEIERGTNRLAWTQSITRTRWLVTKVLVTGLLIVLISGGLIALARWWFSVTHGAIPGASFFGPTTGGDILPGRFDVSGYVVVGYALFAFTLGVFLGALFRRARWAMLAGLPLFGLTRLLVGFVRPHLAPTALATGVSPDASQWVLHAGYLAIGWLGPVAGTTWSTNSAEFRGCVLRNGFTYDPLSHGSFASTATLQEAHRHCLSSLKLHYVAQYQPGSHYWWLQTAETAIFVVAAILLLGVTVVAVRRWRT